MDLSGGATVHLLGGASAVAAALYVGPRKGRYDKGTKPLPLGSAPTAFIGFMLLWFVWLPFNSSSSFAVTGNSWKFAARGAVDTALASFAGGLMGFMFSLIRTKGKIIDPLDFMNGVLGSLVSITAGCFLYVPWSSLIVGGIGALITLLSIRLVSIQTWIHSLKSLFKY